jgi:hypothetical protein
MLTAAHHAGQLQFFGKHVSLTNARAFATYLAPLRNSKWVVYSKRPFGGPAEVLRYLARYTHRVAISNRRLVALDDKNVTLKWKDYRIEGPERYQIMTLDTHEFIRRFLMHILPQGFHRIRCYGFLISQTRAKNIARIRALLAVPLIPIDAIKAAYVKPEQPKRPTMPAHVAAGTCASSRSSCPVNNPNTAQHRCHQRSGSTPHNANTIIRHAQRRSPLVLALRRQHSRLARHTNRWRNDTSKQHNLVTRNARGPIAHQLT